MKNNTFNHIAFTRQRLGLTQQQLAVYTGVSRAQISMAEKNRRAPSTLLLLKLASLETELTGLGSDKINAGAAGAVSAYQPHKDAAEITLNRRQARCDQQLHALTARLTDMEARFLQLNESLQMVEQLLQREHTRAANDVGGSGEGLNGKVNRPGIVLLELQQERLWKKISDCNPLAQAMLRNRLQKLQTDSGLNENIRRQWMLPAL